jgi:carboxypeptidase C (cathepsin A)
MKLTFTIAAVTICSGLGAPEADLVENMPGFSGKMPYKMYSGYLTVPGPINGYDELQIHYEFHESLGSPSSDPVVTWHQGGPGGSSMYGQYGEMGYFQVSDDNNGSVIYSTNSENSWNSVANMLFLESPAGSNDPIGFSKCIKNGKEALSCRWDDVTQAQAYAHTLNAFFDAFPAYAKRDLYLSGESYAGQYLPNIANYILNSNATVTRDLMLKGILVGIGCWGGDETTVQCNGPNSDQNDLDMYFGKGMVSKIAYDQAYKECDFPSTKGLACRAAIEGAFKEVGPFNVYNMYDNCNPRVQEWFERSGKSMHWLLKYLREKMSSGVSSSEYSSELRELAGGYDWSCGSLPAMATYFKRDDVRKALHLQEESACAFDYSTSGPASITLYPKLIKQIRVLIYNGDADACVPYKGNEQWVEQVASDGVVKAKKAWHPWYAEGIDWVPAGYATTYSVADNSDLDFQFVTIRLAGHMVPAFQPHAAYTFFKTFIAGEEI